MRLRIWVGEKREMAVVRVGVGFKQLVKIRSIAMMWNIILNGRVVINGYWFFSCDEALFLEPSEDLIILLSKV